MKGKQLLIAASIVMVVSLLFGGLVAGKDESSPLALLWDAIFGLQDNVVDLQDQIDTIELTPEPTGPPGPTGEQGPTGPQGEQGICGSKGTTCRFFTYFLPCFY